MAECFFFFVTKKLIRTTYWTRFITDKRPDESDDYHTAEETVDQHPLTDMDSIATTVIKKSPDEADNGEKETKPRKGVKQILGLFLKFICGIDSAETDDLSLEAQARLESIRRVENFYSLNQSKLEKYALNVNLVLIILIAVGLYAFFSIPPELHMFRGLINNASSTSV
jgi:hypothetical protein